MFRLIVIVGTILHQRTGIPSDIGNVENQTINSSSEYNKRFTTSSVSSHIERLKLTLLSSYK